MLFFYTSPGSKARFALFFDKSDSNASGLAKIAPTRLAVRGFHEVKRPVSLRLPELGSLSPCLEAAGSWVLVMRIGFVLQNSEIGFVLQNSFMAVTGISPSIVSTRRAAPAQNRLL